MSIDINQDTLPEDTRDTLGLCGPGCDPGCEWCDGTGDGPPLTVHDDGEISIPGLGVLGGPDPMGRLSPRQVGYVRRYGRFPPSYLRDPFGVRR